MKHEMINEQSEISKKSFNDGRGDQVFAGGFMLLLGGIFLMGTMGLTVLGRSAWWLMALVPVYWILIMAYRRYRQDGRFSRGVFAILIWSLLPFMYVLAAPLGINTAAIWPIGLIAAGVGMLIFGSKS